jgi:hypothetical protein
MKAYSFKVILLAFKFLVLSGAQYLMGENLKVIWAEFSTLS